MDKNEKIPSFGFKSSFFIVFVAFITNIIIPFALEGFISDTRPVILACNALFLGLAVAISRFFIDTKRGFSKAFITTYVIFGFSFGLITYFWLYLGNYI